MSSVDEVIAATRTRLQQIRSRGTDLNEQNTKATLIDPVLAALGWDLHSVDEVDREYKRKPQDNPVDYALLLARVPRLFIEAKALRADLTDRKWVSQTLGYATVVGVEWCVLTNGDEYRLYNAHAAVDVDEKLFRAVRISDETEHDTVRATLELLAKDKMATNLLGTIWQDHFVDRQVDGVVGRLLQDPDPALVRLIQKRLPQFRPPEIRDSLMRADIRITFPREALADGAQRRMMRRSRAAVPPPRPAPVRVDVALSDLIASGHVRPPLRLEVKYKGHSLTADVRADGRVAFGGAVYDSPSTAAAYARMMIIGKPANRNYPHTNGWTFWRCQDPVSGKWVVLDALRQRLLDDRRRGS